MLWDTEVKASLAFIVEVKASQEVAMRVEKENMAWARVGKASLAWAREGKASDAISNLGICTAASPQFNAFAPATVRLHIRTRQYLNMTTFTMEQTTTDHMIKVGTALIRIHTHHTMTTIPAVDMKKFVTMSVVKGACPRARVV